MILLLASLSRPKESGMVLGNLLVQSFMKKVNPMINMGRLAKDEFIRTVRVALESTLPFQGSFDDESWSPPDEDPSSEAKSH